jgi:exportin-2 (importin alpha re-exporter)
LKSQVCDNIALYAQKYDEEFHSYLPQFVTSVWNVLVTTDLGPKYDMLVSNALQFLVTVADKTQYGYLFEDVKVLTSTCEKVIIPNVAFRVSDDNVENAEEYIPRDIEGSDVDTRRRAAYDLVQVFS